MGTKAEIKRKSVIASRDGGGESFLEINGEQRQRQLQPFVLGSETSRRLSQEPCNHVTTERCPQNCFLHLRSSTSMAGRLFLDG